MTLSPATSAATDSIRPLSPNFEAVPKQVPGVTGIVAVAAGFGHSLALKSDGTVLAWGSDFRGVLGDGTPGSPDNDGTPSAVVGLSGLPLRLCAQWYPAVPVHESVSRAARALGAVRR